MLNLHTLAFWALVLFVFAIPWERDVAIPFFGGAGTPFGIFALLCGFLAVIRAGYLKLRPPSLLLILTSMFVLWSALTYFWSINPATTLARTISYAQLLAMLWLIWQFTRSSQDFRRLLQAFVLGCYVACLFVFISFMSGEARVIDPGGLERFSFGRHDPNYLALTLVLGIPMAWHLYTKSKHSLFSLLNLSYLPIAMIIVGLTGSRGGLIATIVALSIIPLTYWHMHFWRKIALILAMIAATYGTLLYIPETTFQRLTRTPEDIATENLAGRQNIWRSGLVILSENERAILIGVGSGNFAFAIEAIHGSARSAHNAYLNILTENGLVGLILFLACFAVALVPNLSKQSDIRSFSLILILSLAVGIFVLSWEREKSLWFVLGLLATYRAPVIRPMVLRLLPSTREPKLQDTPVSLSAKRP